MEALGRRRSTHPIPARIRERVVAYARAYRARGVSWKNLAQPLGICPTTVQRWKRQADSPAAVGVVAVQIDEAAAATGSPSPARSPESAPAEGRPFGTLVLTTPGGYRLEGLSLSEAAGLLRRLEP